MWSRGVVILFAGFIGSSTPASSSKEEIVSLLMSEDEEKAYKREAIADGDKEQKQSSPQQEVNTPPTYTIQAIIFHNKKQWTVWINGKSYTPQCNALTSLISINAVSGQSVEIAEKGSVSLVFTGQNYQVVG